MNFCYRFPVVKGIQAEKVYYIAMVPLKTLTRLFPDDDVYVLPEYRAQRRINESRIPEISRYILKNRDSYVFSALAASIDGNHEFVTSGNEELGMLEIDMDAKFLINDGQHRKAAIIAAIEEDSTLGNETIPVVFYEDKGLTRSQQMFTDLNKHAVKTSNSIAELYDSRDPLAVATRNVISKIPFLDDYVDKEKDILGKFSSSLFALNTFYKANRKILGKNVCDQQYEDFLLKFWAGVSENMLPWIDVANRNLSKKDLREQYIASQAVIIQALGRVGAYLYQIKAFGDTACLEKLKEVNWRRNAEVWKGRVIRNDGKMLTSNTAVILSGNIIKQILEIELSDEEKFAENQFKNNF